MVLIMERCLEGWKAGRLEANQSLSVECLYMEGSKPSGHGRGNFQKLKLPKPRPPPGGRGRRRKDIKRLRRLKIQELAGSVFL